MSEPIIHDLDVLRPQPEYVQLAGKKINIAGIPSGIAVDIIGLHGKLLDLAGSPEKLKKIEAGEDAEKSFEVAAELCGVITRAQHKEMTKDWLLKNTDIVQLVALMNYIIKAVQRSLGGVEDEDAKKL